MHVFMSEEFRRDCSRHRLAFTCEDCRHFGAEQDACAVLYPTTPHRNATLAATGENERVYFCKMFEAD